MTTSVSLTVFTKLIKAMFLMISLMLLNHFFHTTKTTQKNNKVLVTEDAN